MTLSRRDSPLCEHRGWLALACVIALAFQLAIIARSELIAPDTVVFLRMAQSLPDFDRVVHQFAQHPGHPLLIKLVHDAFNLSLEPSGWVTAARIVSGVAGVLLVVAIWLLTGELFDRSTANVAAILTACLSEVRINAADGLSDAPHVALFCLAFWMLSRAVRTRCLGWFLVCGLCSGLAYWIRPEGLAVAGVAVGFLGMQLFSTRWAPRRHSLRALAAVGVCAALVVWPYAQRTQGLTRKLVQKEHFATWRNKILPTAPTPHSTKPAQPNLRTSHDQPPHSQPRFLAAGPDSAQPAGESSEGSRLLSMLQRAVEVLLTRVGETYHLLLLVLISTVVLWSVPQSPRFFGQLVLLLVTAYLALLIALFCLGGYMERRHTIPLLTVIIPTSSAVLRYVLDRHYSGLGARTRLTIRVRPICSIAFCCLFFLATVPRNTMAARPENDGLQEVVEWYQHHAGAADRLVCNSQCVAFYTQKPPYVFGSLKQLRQWIEQAAAQQQRCLIVFRHGVVQEHQLAEQFTVPDSVRREHTSTVETASSRITLMIVGPLSAGNPSADRDH